MGVAGEKTYKVVDDDHFAIVRHCLLVDRGSGDVGLFGIDIPPVIVWVPTVVLRRVDAGVEKMRVVVHRDVGVLHTFVDVGVVTTWCSFRHAAYSSPSNGS